MGVTIAINTLAMAWCLVIIRRDSPPLKAQIIAALKADGDKFAQCIEGLTDQQLGETVTLPGGSKSRFEMLLGVTEHEMHHRAQLFVIERMVGIVPHLTRAPGKHGRTGARALR
jgi:uncharacterized damage-inducible protein DinB